MEKMTNAKALNSTIAFLTEKNFDAEVITKLTALLASIEKHSASKANKPSKTQRENVKVKEELFNILTTPMTAMEIADATPYTSQKVVALLSQMVAEGTVIRHEGKGKVKTTFEAVKA